MSWIIGVDPAAREQMQAFDPSLRSELVEHVAIIAANHGDVLYRSPAITGLWVSHYDSQIVLGLRVTLYFAEIEGRHWRFVLRAVTHHMVPGDEGTD